MIYTSNLTQQTRHIIIFHKTTPLCVVKLSVFFDDINGDLYVDYVDVYGWIDHVQRILNKYGKKFNIDPKDLNAKPILTFHDWDI